MPPEVAWFAYAPAQGPTAAAGGPDRDRPPEFADIARLGRRALRGALRVARADESPLPGDAVRAHLGADDVEALSETWPTYETVNVQRALDAWLGASDRTHRVFGLTGFREDLSLTGILASSDPNETGLGTVSRTNRPCGPDGATMACLDRSLILADDPRGPVALYLGARGMGPVVSLVLEAMSPVPGLAADTLADLRRLGRELNVFRGQVLSFGAEMFGYGESVLQFHRRPDLERDDLILADHLLEAVERQVVGVATHRRRLVAAGQHLKRGLLLYGPPGVGKTHTIRYLTSTLTDTTFITISGPALEAIGTACSVARSLQPSVVVVEDVDLIAEDRGFSPGQHPLLFQLLNEMDGVGGDSDIAFVLTTNRADLLEPALAARPGRVDQAIEIDLPDVEARRRLFWLYRGGLEIDATPQEVEAVLDRAEGVTASFLKELLRRAAVTAAMREAAAGDRADDADENTNEDAREDPGEEAAPLTVTAADLEASLADLLSTRNTMTRALLGSPDPTEGTQDADPNDEVFEASWTGEADLDTPGWES